MGKTIWIVNQYASTPKVGMGGRHYYIARELSKLGYKVYLIAGSYAHKMNSPPNVKDQYEIEKIDGINIVWVRVFRYLKSTSKLRMLNWIVFSLKLVWLRRVIKDPPDFIICSSPSLVSFLGAYHLARYYKAILAFDVRDIWPLTLVRLGGFSTSNPFIQFLQKVEDIAYLKSDVVFSNLENSYVHMESRGMDGKKFHWIPNGFCLAEVENPSSLSKEVMEKIPSKGFIVGYVGSLGVANCLDTLIDAAGSLRAHRTIKFVIVGEGSEKNRLIELVRSRSLSNCIFIDRIPKPQVQAMIRNFSCCYLGWTDSDLYDYGIGANKITDYLYGGKPVINSYSGSSDPFVKYECGLNVKAQEVDSLVKAIETVFQMSKINRSKMGHKGRKAALDNYEYSNLASSISKILEREKYV